ncbi:MAG: glycosyltransferase family 2 protein [Pyrinomonadaceae bacterium]
MKLLSVVIPCFNEELVLRTAHERLTQAVSAIDGFEYELIFVDDGSRDDTFKILGELQSHDPHTRVLKLSRNFGHQVAVTAGLEAAMGDVNVVIDADLQDPPEVVPQMIDLWHQGHHVVYGTRATRAGESRFKLMTAKAFYRIINRFSDTAMPVDTGDFRLMDRKVVDVLLSMPERGRFLRGMVSWIGFRQAPLAYERQPRRAGRTKYSLFRMIHFALDGILSFSVLPLRLASFTGLVAIWFALAGIIMAVVVRFLGLYDLRLGRGWASLFVAVLFMGGVQLLSLGVMGEYLGRIYTEVKRRPLYAVQERLGFEVPSSELPDSRTTRGPAKVPF